MMTWTMPRCGLPGGSAMVVEGRSYNMKFGELTTQIRFDLKINGPNSASIWTKISKLNKFINMTKFINLSKS